MKLMPKKTKYRKLQRGTMKGLSKGCRTVAFGEFGLQALTPAWISAQQIEALRVTLSRTLKKEGKFFIRMFPDRPVTKKPAETRMGKGKGNPEFWAAVVKRGRIMCEVSGISEQRARDLMKVVTSKLPIRTRFVTKQETLMEETNEKSC